MTTAEHPFWTKRGWRDAADLEPGEELLTRDGNWHPIRNTHTEYEDVEVYSLEIGHLNTYFVGGWEWLVHNAKKTKCLSELFTEALENADKWKYWKARGTRDLRDLLKLVKSSDHDHHLIPLELLKKLDVVQEAYRGGFKFNGLVNGKGLDIFTHIAKDGKLIYSHAPYTKYVEQTINAAKKQFPDLPAKDLLEKKVLPEINEFIEEAIKQKSSISDFATKIMSGL